MLINLSNHHQINLPRAWEELIEEGYANLAKLENEAVDTKNG